MNVAVGVKVTMPVIVFTVAMPGAVPIFTVSEDGFIGPPPVWQRAQTFTGVLMPVLVNIGLAIGAVPVTLMVINALVHEIGNRLQML